MNFDEFKSNFYSSILPEKHSDLRDGQCLMHYLNKCWYKEYVRVSSIDYYSAVDIDCFYNDKLIEYTFKHLESVWENYPN